MMSDNHRAAPRDQRLFTQLSTIAQDGAELVRLELRLARQETVEKLRPAAQGGGMIATGGLLATFGSRYLVEAVVQALATRMPRWLASLLVGTGLTTGGLALARRGGREVQDIDLVPERTIHSFQETKAWLVEQVKSRLL